LDSFLTFLAFDLQQNPQHISLVTPDLVSRIKKLVGDVDLNLDAQLNDEDE